MRTQPSPGPADDIHPIVRPRRPSVDCSPCIVLSPIHQSQRGYPRALSKAKREWSAEDDDFDGSEKELGAGLSVLSEEPDRQENESTFPSHKCLKRQLTSAEPSEV